MHKVIPHLQIDWHGFIQAVLDNLPTILDGVEILRHTGVTFQELQAGFGKGMYSTLTPYQNQLEKTG